MQRRVKAAPLLLSMRSRQKRPLLSRQHSKRSRSVPRRALSLSASSAWAATAFATWGWQPSSLRRCYEASTAQCARLKSCSSRLSTTARLYSRPSRRPQQALRGTISHV